MNEEERKGNKIITTLFIIAIALIYSGWYATERYSQSKFGGTYNTFSGNTCDYAVGNHCAVYGNVADGNFSVGKDTFTFNGVTCKDDQVIRKNIIGLLYCSNQ